MLSCKRQKEKKGRKIDLYQALVFWVILFFTETGNESLMKHSAEQ